MAKGKALCVDGTKAHHWVIDSDNIGRCIRPGCGKVKDFSPRRNRDTLPEWISAPKKRGRPRKNAIPTHI